MVVMHVIYALSHTLLSQGRMSDRFEEDYHPRHKPRRLPRMILRYSCTKVPMQ